jgi:hypothetical protein
VELIIDRSFSKSPRFIDRFVSLIVGPALIVGSAVLVVHAAGYFFLFDDFALIGEVRGDN